VNPVPKLEEEEEEVKQQVDSNFRSLKKKCISWIFCFIDFSILWFDNIHKIHENWNTSYNNKLASVCPDTLQLHSSVNPVPKLEEEEEEVKQQ
jgi:hypothetical protein